MRMSPLAGAVLVLAAVASGCTAAESTTAAAPAAVEAASPAGSPAETASPTPSSTPQEYLDRNARDLLAQARARRPVEPSAMPPRHLDAERWPQSLVERNEIVSGGVPPDGIPSIDDPVFQPARTVDWLDDDEAVLVLQLDGVVRAYPVQVMVWHEIVNDVVDDRPVVVTYCPLCNSGVAADRRLDGRVLEFGTSGTLYRSGLVMYDRQTESLWTHFDGRAVIGTLMGAQLELLSVATVGWADFVAAHPDAPVLTRDTGRDRPYGRNPYPSYDSLDRPLRGFYSADLDPRLPPMARVLGVQVGSDAVAVPLDVLAAESVMSAEAGGRELVLWHAPGLASSLDAPEVADGDDVGATGVFVASVDGEVPRFRRDGGVFLDDLTGSAWNVLGEAVAGPLAGTRLEPVPHVDTFWFAWSSYREGTALLRGEAATSGGGRRP